MKLNPDYLIWLGYALAVITLAWLIVEITGTILYIAASRRRENRRKRRCRQIQPR